MKATWAFLLGLLLAALLGATGLGLCVDDGFDVEVRTVPRRTQAGRLQRVLPLGQGFRCEFDGLQRIDVGLVPLIDAQDASLELILRRERLDGPVVRRVAASELPVTSGWGVFEFEPIEDSAGEAFWWQLDFPDGPRQSPYSPWIRYHGQVGIDMGWGGQVLKGQVFQGQLADQEPGARVRGAYTRIPHPNLCAVSFAAENMRPAVGPIRLELWGAQQRAFEDPPLRSVTLDDSEEVKGGYAFFAFEPLEGSRWADLTYRLTVNAGTRLVGSDRGPSRKTWHGERSSPPALLGHSRGTQIHGDRSLVFRAHSSPSLSERLGQILARGGWRLRVGALCWLLAAGLLCRALLAR